jgi:heat shock protein HslJ
MPKKILLILLTLGVSISPFAGCASPESEPGPEEIQTSAPAAIDEASEGLLEHEWHLEAFGTVGEEDEILPGTSITLSFEREGSLSGTSGCNRYSTTFQAGPSGELSIRAFATTQMECAEETMYQERAYLGAFADMTAFDVGADSLQLFYGDYEYAMIFRGETRSDSESGVE